jgi:hypothetical protein
MDDRDGRVAPSHALVPGARGITDTPSQGPFADHWLGTGASALPASLSAR